MISRRELFKLSLLGILSRSALSNLQTRDQPFFIQFNMFGAPSRWGFDLPLAPYESLPKNRNLMVANEISLSGKEVMSSLINKTINGVNLPLIWSTTVDTDLDKSDLSSVYENMIIFRGARMASDGHEINSQKLMSPFGQGSSLNAKISETYQAPFSPVQLLQSYSPFAATPGAYRSSKGLGAINLRFNEDLGKSLFGYNFDRDQLKNDNDLLSLIHKKNKDYKKNSTLDLDFQKLHREYEKALVKYQKLILLTKKRIELSISKNDPILFKAPKKISEEAARSEFGHFYFDGHLLSMSNIREIQRNLSFNGLAEKFAIAEVIARHRLSSSLLLMLDPPGNMTFSGLYISSGEFLEETRPLHTFDTHDIGSVGEVLLNNCFYEVFVTLLNSFVITLKKDRIFDSSLIHITSEFSRTPRHDCSGSDHGWQGQTSTLIGGMLKGTRVYGDILKNSSKDSDHLHPENGIWGAGAPLDELKGRYLRYRNVLSTICDILEIERLSKSDMGLLKKVSTNKFESILKRAKNV